MLGGPRPDRDLADKAQDALEERRFPEALEVFDELVRMNPEDTESWVNRGEVLALLNRMDEATTSYERALESDPDHRAAPSELGDLLFEMGSYGPAGARLPGGVRRWR